MDIDMEITAMMQPHLYLGPQPMDIDMEITAMMQPHLYLGPQPMDIDMEITAMMQPHLYRDPLPINTPSIADVSKMLCNLLKLTYLTMPHDTTINIQAQNDQYHNMCCDFNMSFAL
jgi:hypothetical protein